MEVKTMSIRLITIPIDQNIHIEQLRDLDIVEVYNVDEEYEYDSSTTRVVTPATTKSAVVTSIATRVKQ